MNTPAHLVVNAAFLARGQGRVHWKAILLGGVVPDAAMYVFFFWATFLTDMPQGQIWEEAYFRDAWQDFFDLFNSVPLALAGLGLAWWGQRKAALFFFASALLHFAFDLPLHHDDAHRHFFPLWSWRFESPVSYWDPGHYGRIVGLAEALGVWVSCTLLWQRFPTTVARQALGALAGIYALLVGLALFFDPPTL